MPSNIGIIGEWVVLHLSGGSFAQRVLTSPKGAIALVRETSPCAMRGTGCSGAVSRCSDLSGPRCSECPMHDGTLSNKMRQAPLHLKKEHNLPVRAGTICALTSSGMRTLPRMKPTHRPILPDNNNIKAATTVISRACHEDNHHTISKDADIILARRWCRQTKKMTGIKT